MRVNLSGLGLFIALQLMTAACDPEDDPAAAGADAGEGGAPQTDDSPSVTDDSPAGEDAGTSEPPQQADAATEDTSPSETTQPDSDPEELDGGVTGEVETDAATNVDETQEAGTSDAAATGGDSSAPDETSVPVEAGEPTETATETELTDTETDDAVDGGSETDSIDSGAQPPDLEGEKWGIVALTQSSTTIDGVGTIVASGAVATFGLTYPTAEDDDSCVYTTVGDCVLFTCDAEETDPAEPPPTELPFPYAPGDISITGLAYDLNFSRLESTGGYMSQAIAAWLWAGSEAVHLQVGASADVPAFEMDLTLPSRIALTAPVLSTGVEISTASDLAFTWTGGVDGLVMLDAYAAFEGGSQGVQCTADAADGAFSIDAELLQDLVGAGTGTVSVSSNSMELIEVEDWRMQFQATNAVAAAQVVFTD